MKPTKFLIVPVLLGLAGLATAAALQEAAPEKAQAPSPREIAMAQLPSYPLSTCVVSGEELSADSTVDAVVEGRLYRLCCEKCKGAVEKDAAAYEAKIVAAVIADQGPRYPLKTCPVSGEALGSMGAPIDHVDGTKLVRFCCKGCVKGYPKDPAAYMAKVDEAWIASQLADYPLDVCVVMEGDPLEGPDAEPVNYLYGTRLVRLCCKSCIKKLKKNPDVFLAKLDAARAAK